MVDYSGDSLEGNCDAPRLNLVTSAIQALRNPPEKFDGVFELSAR